MYLSATTKTASECPYKECIHRVSLEPPESEPQAADVAEVVPVAMEESHRVTTSAEVSLSRVP